MKTTLDRKELIKALKTIKSGLANREIIEQSTHFAFMGDRVVTYNDEISISHPVPLNITGAVDAKPFLKFLEANKVDTLDIEVVDDKLILTGQSKAEFVFYPEIRLPLEEIGKLDPWRRIENPLRFFETLKFCRDTCSNDMSRPILTCIHVGSDFMESSDNNQYSWCAVPDALPVKPFLIPGDILKPLFQHEITHIAESKGWVHFKSIDGTDFACRIFDEKYSDTTGLKEKITAAKQGIKIMFPADTKQMIDSVSPVLSSMDFESDKAITVTIENKKLIIEAEGRAGHQSTKASLRYAGDPVSFMVKPEFLQDALKVSRECYIGKDVILFKSRAGVRLIGLVPV